MITKFKLIPKYYLGQNVVIDYLPKELKKHQVKTALLVAGGGSIKRNKLYDHIKAACKRAHVKLIEHWGIEPNPRDEGIYRAALLARKTHCDLIIAAGGGSVIDAAKVVGIVAKNPVYKDA
jgi:alcohol dehydrogenase YqhD (iron-dependent ADH family)